MLAAKSYNLPFLEAVADTKTKSNTIQSALDFVIYNYKRIKYKKKAVYAAGLPMRGFD